MWDVSGGHIADYPGPHRRYYDDRRRKRKVTVGVIVYSIGKHYWVSMRQDDNPIWDGKSWRLCWDDKESRGRVLSRQCDNKIEVHHFVRHAMHFVFPGHKLDWEPYSKTFFVYPEHD